jgi:two-component system sensor histidine kinase RegB
MDNFAPMMPPADLEDALITLWRLVWLRWLLLAGALAAVVAVPPLLGIPLPTAPLLLVIGVLGVFNAGVMRRLRRAEVQSHAALALQVSVDLVALGVLLFLSGGAANPLVSLLLLPVASAALILSWPWAAGIAAAAITLYSLLAVWFVPLQIADVERATRLHLAGMWLTFVVSVVLIAWLIVRMTASIRARDAALARAREQALRDERVVALGALAAGAAHELGTPLATIAVIAGELERESELSAAAREDLQLLRQQVAACKEIVTRLASRAGVDRAQGAQAQPADRWLDALLARWRATRPGAACFLACLPVAAAPRIVVDETLEQGVVNLLNNAANSDGDEIEVLLDWNAVQLTIDVLDRGPGFPAQVLMQAGSGPLPSATGGAGIGLLLTQAAIGRLGGRLLLTNRTTGGGSARIELPLAGILAEQKP